MGGNKEGKASAQVWMAREDNHPTPEKSGDNIRLLGYAVAITNNYGNTFPSSYLLRAYYVQGLRFSMLGIVQDGRTIGR